MSGDSGSSGGGGGGGGGGVGGVGGGGSAKETSPVCLQMLDCLWQVQQQFPSQFEFSEQFVTLISQSLYSGLFTTFRGNCERERVLQMRRVAAFEDMAADDFDFSTLRCYVHILLRCPGSSGQLLNPSYSPPTPSQKKVSTRQAKTLLLLFDVHRP